MTNGRMLRVTRVPIGSQNLPAASSRLAPALLHSYKALVRKLKRPESRRKKGSQSYGRGIIRPYRALYPTVGHITFVGVRGNEPSMQPLSILAFLAMIVSLAGLILAHALFSWSPITIGLQVCAGSLMLWARLTFGTRSFHGAANPTEGGLVTTGPYRYIRHPIYTSVVLFVWASAVANWSLAIVAMAALGTAGALVRMLCEEQLLVQRYPEYATYAKVTNRMIPYLF